VQQAKSYSLSLEAGFTKLLHQNKYKNKVDLNGAVAFTVRLEDIFLETPILYVEREVDSVFGGGGG
jgi:hypothetical protein